MPVHYVKWFSWEAICQRRKNKSSPQEQGWGSNHSRAQVRHLWDAGGHTGFTICRNSSVAAQMEPVPGCLAQTRDSALLPPTHVTAQPSATFLSPKIYTVPPPHPFLLGILFHCRLGYSITKLILMAYKIINDKLEPEEVVTKLCNLALTSVAQWVGRRPAKRKVTGLIPSQVRSGWRFCPGPGRVWEAPHWRMPHTPVSLSFSFSLPSPLSKNR